MHSLLTDELDYEKARQQLTVKAEEKKLAQRNTSVHDGDYWQNGEGYIGPRPTPGTNGYDATWINIQKLFRSEGVYKEIISRQINALFSRPPVISFERKTVKTANPADPQATKPGQPPPPKPKPTPPQPLPGQDPTQDPTGPTKTKLPVPPTAEAARNLNPDGTVKEPDTDPLIEEITGVFGEWLNSKDVRLAMIRVLERRLLTQHGAWRYFVPARMAVLENNKSKDLFTILRNIGIDEPTLELSRVIKDPVDNSLLSVTQYGLTETDKQGRIEVCFTDDDGRTFIGLFLPGTNGTPDGVATASALALDGLQAGLNRASLQQQGAAGAEPTDATEKIDDDGQPEFQARSQPLELNGNLLVYEMTGAALTSEQVWQNTKALSLSLTMTNHVGIESGHSEMALTNVEIETVEISDLTSPDGKRTVPKSQIERGQSAVNNFIGIEQQNPDGSVTNANPQVLWKEPSPVTTQVDSYDLAKRAILDEVHQLHALIADKATASGESRIQALADFVEATTRLQTEVNHFGTWVIETALYLCANLLGRKELLDVRGRFEAQITAGRLSSDQEAQVLAQVDKKIRSKRSARSLLSIYDSEAEELQIRREAQDGMTMPDSMTNPANPMSPLNPENIKRQEQQAADAAKNLPPGKGRPPLPTQP